jgi:hypothetical protein
MLQSTLTSILNNQNHVWKLKRAIYGLRQSPHLWKKVLDDFLSTQRFRQSTSDPCVYTRNIQNAHKYIAVSVDDLILISKDETTMLALKAMLHARFKMKDLGILTHCLGITFRRLDSSCFKKQYIEELLVRFNIQHCNTATTPMDHPTITPTDHPLLYRPPLPSTGWLPAVSLHMHSPRHYNSGLVIVSFLE